MQLWFINILDHCCNLCVCFPSYRIVDFKHPLDFARQSKYKFFNRIPSWHIEVIDEFYDENIQSIITKSVIYYFNIIFQLDFKNVGIIKNNVLKLDVHETMNDGYIIDDEWMMGQTSRQPHCLCESTSLSYSYSLAFSITTTLNNYNNTRWIYEDV